MTFDAVGVFGLTFDFLLKICLIVLCPPPLLTLSPLHTSPSPPLRAQPDWAYEFPDRTGPDTQIAGLVLPDRTESGLMLIKIFLCKKKKKKV